MDERPVLGFDIGAKCIGVAVGSALSASARSLDVVDGGGGNPDWAAIERMVGEWRPGALVVGDPLQLDPTAPDQPARRRAHAFARQAARRFGLPVWLVDERHSSQEASRRFAAQRAGGVARRREAARIDALAAVVILERWLVEPTAALRVELP